MSITILLDYSVAPDQADEYAASLSEKFIATRAFAGCEGIAAYRDAAAPERFVVVQHWISDAHYDRYIAWRKETGGVTETARNARASHMRKLGRVA